MQLGVSTNYFISNITLVKSIEVQQDLINAPSLHAMSLPFSESFFGNNGDGFFHKRVQDDRPVVAKLMKTVVIMPFLPQIVFYALKVAHCC